MSGIEEKGKKSEGGWDGEERRKTPRCLNEDGTSRHIYARMIRKCLHQHKDPYPTRISECPILRV